MMLTYVGTAVVLVLMSFAGMFINPAATPARVALGVITILSVWTNFLGLMRTVPDGIVVMNVWLLHFLSAYAGLDPSTSGLQLASC